MEIFVVQIPRELAWKLRASLTPERLTAAALPSRAPRAQASGLLITACPHSSRDPLNPSHSQGASHSCDLPVEKNLAISIDGSLNLRVFYATIQCAPMPSQHSPDKEPPSLQIPRTLMGRLRR